MWQGVAFKLQVYWVRLVKWLVLLFLGGVMIELGI